MSYHCEEGHLKDDSHSDQGGEGDFHHQEKCLQHSDDNFSEAEEALWKARWAQEDEPEELARWVWGAREQGIAQEARASEMQGRRGEPSKARQIEQCEVFQVHVRRGGSSVFTFKATQSSGRSIRARASSGATPTSNTSKSGATKRSTGTVCTGRRVRTTTRTSSEKGNRMTTTTTRLRQPSGTSSALMGRRDQGECDEEDGSADSLRAATCRCGGVLAAHVASTDRWDIVGGSQARYNHLTRAHRELKRRDDEDKGPKIVNKRNGVGIYRGIFRVWRCR